MRGVTRTDSEVALLVELLCGVAARAR